MSGENGAPVGAKKKAVLPKLSFRFKLGGASASGAGSPSNAATDDFDDGGKKKKKKKKRDFDDDDAVATTTFEEEERGGDEEEEEGANHRATKKQKKDADAMTEKKAKQLQAKIDALERQQKQFARERHQQQQQQQQQQGRESAKGPAPRAAPVPKTGRGKELRGMMMGILPSDGPMSSPTTTGNVSGCIDDSNNRLELSRLASGRSVTPGAKNSRNDNNNKTQKKGTKKSGASNTDNTARNIKEQTPPSTVGGGSGLVSAFNIFDDIGEINFPSPPSGGSNLADDILFGGGSGSGQQHHNHPPSSFKSSPFVGGGGGGGGKPAAMLARLEREQEMAKKKGAKSSVSGADVAGQQPQETNQQLPFPSIPSNKNLSVSGGGISGDAKEIDMPPPKKGQMEEIIKHLHKLDKNKVFLNPVTEDIAPGYFQMIDRPMDISTIRSNLKEKKYYTSWSMFEEDLRLIYTNCQTYNGPNSPYFEIARQCLKEMRSLIHEKILESLSKKKGFSGTFPQMSSVFPSLDDPDGDSSRQQSDLVSEGVGDFSRDNSDDENDEKAKRGMYQKKKNRRDTFRPYNVFGKSDVDREPFHKRCPTMQTHCDNQLLQAYRYNSDGVSVLVNYSNHVANMKEKPYEVFPPLGRNISFVAYVNSIKAFAGELSPLSDEEEDGEGKEKDKKNMHTQKTQNKAFVAKWIKERTKECDAWRDLMYIPEPPKDPMMEKVGREQTATLATANATGTGGAPKLSAAAAAAAAAEQSHARALAAAKSQQRILAHPVKPAAPLPLPQMTLKKSNSNTFPAQRSARGVLALVTEEAKKSVFEARKRWQLAGAALQGQVSEDVLKTDPLERLAGSSITVSEIVSMLPSLNSERSNIESSGVQDNGSTPPLSTETSSSPVQEPGQKKSLRDIIQGLAKEYRGALRKFGF